MARSGEGQLQSNTSGRTAVGVVGYLVSIVEDCESDESNLFPTTGDRFVEPDETIPPAPAPRNWSRGSGMMSICV
jgi:hypothetical protein